MDFDEERDFQVADQGPLTDILMIDMEEDAQILATLLKHLPSCINAADMEHPGLLQDMILYMISYCEQDCVVVLVFNVKTLTRRCPWCTSAHLSPLS